MRLIDYYYVLLSTFSVVAFAQVAHIIPYSDKSCQNAGDMISLSLNNDGNCTQISLRNVYSIKPADLNTGCTLSLYKDDNCSVGTVGAPVGTCNQYTDNSNILSVSVDNCTVGNTTATLTTSSGSGSSTTTTSGPVRTTSSGSNASATTAPGSTRPVLAPILAPILTVIAITIAFVLYKYCRRMWCKEPTGLSDGNTKKMPSHELELLDRTEAWLGQVIAPRSEAAHARSFTDSEYI
ncbi:hypothetical protein BP5796_02841 [Coleophoma crateriformis]|uniref:Uncharacterized protein n=1 Tax=Coleophoma crateriformis TaxID=565419 RepID=A0A3D8SZF1_9HELO|nr:hypothetical protein BP5796_02841 [Coleophoma crateriformis]